MRKTEGVSLTEAKVEAAKLSRGGKTVSIIEDDGDFFVKVGSDPDAYMTYINGGKSDQASTKKMSKMDDQVEGMGVKKKQDKPPVIHSLATKKLRHDDEVAAKATKSKKMTDEEIEATEKKVMAKVAAAQKEKARPKVAVIEDEEEDEEEVIVTKSNKNKSNNQNSNNMKAKTAVKKSTAVKKDMPFSWIVEMVQAKKKVARELIKKALLKDYAEGTANTQMSRIKNHPNLVVNGDIVAWQK
jgi:type IV secretory pathway VirB10-like protein